MLAKCASNRKHMRRVCKTLHPFKSISSLTFPPSWFPWITLNSSEWYAKTLGWPYPKMFRLKRSDSGGLKHSDKKEPRGFFLCH